MPNEPTAAYTGPERRTAHTRFDGPPIWQEATRDRKPGREILAGPDTPLDTLTAMEQARDDCLLGAKDSRVLVDEVAARLMESREAEEDSEP